MKMPRSFRRNGVTGLAALGLGVVLLGCSGKLDMPGDPADLSTPPGTAADLSGTSADLRAGTCPTCGANQVCTNGACQDLPSKCPCPLESYCELASQSCKVGCLADEGCAAGHYCETASRRCLAGCRGDSDCSATQICTANACVTGCRSSGQCPNLTDTCESNRCVNRCGDCNDNSDCTADTCERGKCLHKPANEGGTCPGTTCATNPHCSAGACVSTSAADGSSCGTEYRMCLGGSCQDVAVYCDNSTGGGFTYRDASGTHGGFNVAGSCFCTTVTKIDTTDSRPHACSTCKTDPNKAARRICWQ